MKDVIIVGGGLAGLSAGWRLRHFDTMLLEAENRVGGRIRSERRGQYWLNWGGHVFAGAGSSTDALLTEVGVNALEIPGSLQAVSMNGKLIPRGQIQTYPFRLPMSMESRAAVVKAGAKVATSLLTKYVDVVRRRPGESGDSRQQRIYDFENDRSFLDYIGELPGDAAELFRATVTRSTGEMHEISAGTGIGYFSLILNIGQGLNRGIVGGPSTLTQALAASMGERIQLGAAVQEIVHKENSVVVRYTQNGQELEEEARTVVLATTASVAQRVAVDIPEDIREALGKIVYGPHVSTAFLTNEPGKQHWDDIYAIATPKRSFAIALNHASLVRGSEVTRQPGGSLMTFSPGNMGRDLLDKSDEEVVAIHQGDLEEVLSTSLSPIVEEAHVSRWKEGAPYCFPGRGKLQPTLRKTGSRVFLAGDYLGTLFTETSIDTGFTAAQNAVGVLATDQVRPAPVIVR